MCVDLADFFSNSLIFVANSHLTGFCGASFMEILCWFPNVILFLFVFLANRPVQNAPADEDRSFGMLEKIVTGVKALNIAEMRVRIGEDNRNDPNGHFLPGVVLIWLQQAKNMVYLVVAVRDLPVWECDVCNEPMSLMITKKRTDFNPENTLFYKCRNKNQNDKACENNAYPKYACNDFYRDRADAAANGVEEPVLIDMDGDVVDSTFVQ